MKKIIMTILLLVAYQATAQKYILNGAEIFSKPTLATYQNVRIGTSFGWEADFTCGQFDFHQSIRQQLNNAADRLRTSIVSSVQGLMAALPELLLQRIRPDLYDMYQKLMVRAEADIRVAYQSCQAWKDAFDTSDKGVAEVFKEAASVEWEAQMTANDGDIWQAQQNINANSAERGIRWCDGNFRGGSSTEQLEPLRDAAIAGLNTMFGRTCTSEGTVANRSNQDSPIAKHFPDTESVKAYINEVLGDYVVKGKEKTVREGSIPQGLSGLIDERREELVELITNGVENSYFLNGIDLRKFDTYPGGPKITAEVIEAIRELEKGYQTLTINHLANELAAAYVIDKSLQMKKLLQAAKYVPELASSNFMNSIIDGATDSIDDQIGDIMFEKEIREKFYAQTAVDLIDSYNAARRGNSATVPTERDTQVIKDGGIIRGGGQ
jgi:integrating conjugative element protein (TIGR03755 family)